MESYFGQERSFQTQINVSISQPSIEDAVEAINSGQVSDLTGTVDVLTEGLSSAEYTADCYTSLARIYVENPGQPIQLDIITKLVWSESPNASMLMEELLSDSTQHSMSTQFDEGVKEQLLSLMEYHVDERSNKLVSQIQERDFNIHRSLDVNELKQCLPFWDDREGGGDGDDDELFPNPDVGISSEEEEADDSEDDERLDLEKHLSSWANVDLESFMKNLEAQMAKHADFGRKVGNIIQQNSALRDIVTASVLDIATKYNTNELVIRNTLAYCHAVGEDIAITHMTDAQKSNLYPRLVSESQCAADKVFIAQNELLTRMDAGEIVTVSTLANEGALAVPILLNIRFSLD
ncbi:MAG: hypothetical protein ACPGJS_15420 [Flammeovirgaceae bacterium]